MLMEINNTFEKKTIKNSLSAVVNI